MPSLSINDVSLVEGNSGSANLTFTVTLSAISGKTVTVNYATANGSALAPSDYQGGSGTLTFAPGTATKTIDVPIVGNTGSVTPPSFRLSNGAPGRPEEKVVCDVRTSSTAPAVAVVAANVR